MRIAKVNPEDKEYIFSWIKEIWGGRDYIPHVWDRWIKEGDLFAVYDGDKAIAIWHIRWLNKYAWFEGMRVKPDYQGRGIAKMANRYSIQLAKEKGCEQALLATKIDNKPAHRSLEAVGFERVAAYTMVKIDTSKFYSTSNAETLDWEELESKYPNLKRNNYIMAWRESPWVFLPINKDQFGEINPRDRLKIGGAAAIRGEDISIDEKYLYIRYLDTLDENSLEDLLGYISKEAQKHNLKRIFAYLPYNIELLNIVKRILEIEEKDTFLIYRKLL